MIARLRAILARPAVCRCGHDPEAHTHFRPGSDCGWCDCRRFRRAWLRPRPQPVDLHAVCADEQVINAVEADDLDHALLIAPAPLVAFLVALRDTGRAAA